MKEIITIQEVLDSELKEIIMNNFCYSFNVDDTYVIEFFTWLVWALGLNNS